MLNFNKIEVGEMLKDGFYTALGTPVDENGNLIEKSLVKHISDQIEAGASGLLLMGSMGIEACIKESEYSRIVKVAANAVNKRCPLFVGAMDNSVWRVKEKLNAIGNVNIDGIVMTTPFYYISPQKDIQEYFRKVADASKYPVFLYDLPLITKVKITLDTVLSLAEDRRFGGIKSGDIVLARDLINNTTLRGDFSVLFSTIDVFDTAYCYGIRRNLDGMFSCAPKNASQMYRHFAENDIKSGSKYLNNIISLRNLLVEYGVFPSFTAAMNLLGYDGYFNPDYMGRVTSEVKEKIAEKMKEIGEI